MLSLTILAAAAALPAAAPAAQPMPMPAMPMHAMAMAAPPAKPTHEGMKDGCCCCDKMKAHPAKDGTADHSAHDGPAKQ